MYRRLDFNQPNSSNKNISAFVIDSTITALKISKSSVDGTLSVSFHEDNKIANE